MIILEKTYKAIIVIVFIVLATFLVAKLESVNAANSIINPAKSVKKLVITPTQARNFLNDLDMPTRDYEKTGVAGPYGGYEADSDRFMLETRDANRFLNNLSYSVFGDKYIVKALELDLNVNDLSFKLNAVNQLIKYSNALMFKVTEKYLTKEMKNAMQTQTNGEWVIDGHKIKIKSETFPDEKVIKGLKPTSDKGAFSLAFIIEL